MRHALLLGIFTLLMAGLSTVAFHMDQARNLSRQQIVAQQIDQDLLRLELQFMDQASLLISVLNPADPFLPTLTQTRNALRVDPDPQSREDRFQRLVVQVKARVLKAPETDEASLQEWRRAQDQLNGILNRHRVLQRELEESR